MPFLFFMVFLAISLFLNLYSYVCLCLQFPGTFCRDGPLGCVRCSAAKFRVDWVSWRFSYSYRACWKFLGTGNAVCRYMLYFTWYSMLCVFVFLFYNGQSILKDRGPPLFKKKKKKNPGCLIHCAQYGPIIMLLEIHFNNPPSCHIACMLGATQFDLPGLAEMLSFTSI